MENLRVLEGSEVFFRGLQHPKNRKSYPAMLDGAVSRRHLRKTTAAGQRNIWN